MRITERVIAPEEMDFVSIVTSSHNHTDHLDGETIRPLLAANPHLTILMCPLPIYNLPRVRVKVVDGRIGEENSGGVQK